MTNEKIVEELARIEFGSDVEIEHIEYRPNVIYIHYKNGDLESRNYFRDYNHLHRIINGMDDEKIHLYARALADLRDEFPIIKATPAQMAEAILRAYGKREEEDADLHN